MSIERTIRDLVRTELKVLLKPIEKAVSSFQLDRNRRLLSGNSKSGLAAWPKSSLHKATKVKRNAPGAEKDCAVADCTRPARAKGYCTAHYQKFRALEKTGRLPKDWVPYAKAGTVKDVYLPRGRAGAKALAQVRARRKKK